MSYKTEDGQVYAKTGLFGDDTNNAEFVADGDLIFHGTGGVPYGEISVTGNGNTTATTTKDLWVQFTEFDTDDHEHLTDVDSGNDHIVINHTGMYSLMCSISLSGGGGKTYEMELRRNNGTEVLTHAHVERKMGAAGDIGSATIVGIHDCTTTDTIELWARCIDTGPAAILLKDVTLAVFQIGG